MDAFKLLVVTSIILGLILGTMSCFVFHLPALVSAGIAAVTMIGLFLIMLVLNNITFNRSTRYS